MEIISLRIRTNDEAYGQVLQTVLKRNYPGFMIQLESLPDAKAGAAEAGQEASVQPAGTQTGSWGIDLSLCDDRNQLREGEVLLSEQPFAEAADVESLFKYAPAQEMIEQILELCASRVHRQIFRPANGKCRIVGVFSASGGKGCTAVSLALAQYSARLRGSRPLILPLGQLPHGGACAATAGIMPLREFVYRTLRAENADIPGSGARKPPQSSSLLERAVKTDDFGTGWFAMPPAENPLCRLSADGMQTVLRAVTAGGFDLLFADIGNVMSEAAFTVLRASDQLLMLLDEKDADERMQEYLRTVCGGGVTGKIIPVRNRWIDSAATAVSRFFEDTDEGLAEEAIPIPYEPQLDHERGAARDPVFPLEGGFVDAAEDLLNLLDSRFLTAA